MMALEVDKPKAFLGDLPAPLLCRDFTRQDWHNDDELGEIVMSLCGLDFLGIGLTRMGVALSDDYVLKLPVGRKGKNNNLLEYEIYNKCSEKVRSRLAPVISCSTDGSWIIMQKAETGTTKTKDLVVIKSFFSRHKWCPFDLHHDNIAKIDGVVVAIDYAGFYRY